MPNRPTWDCLRPGVGRSLRRRRPSPQGCGGLGELWGSSGVKFGIEKKLALRRATPPPDHPRPGGNRQTQSHHLHPIFFPTRVQPLKKKILHPRGEKTQTLHSTHCSIAIREKGSAGGYCGSFPAHQPAIGVVMGTRSGIFGRNFSFCPPMVTLAPPQIAPCGLAFTTLRLPARLAVYRRRKQQRRGSVSPPQITPHRPLGIEGCQGVGLPPVPSSPWTSGAAINKHTWW